MDLVILAGLVATIALGTAGLLAVRGRQPERIPVRVRARRRG